MEIRYERDGGSVYMMLPRIDENGSYREKMVLEGSFENLLPMRLRHFNEESSYCYDIRAMQPLSRVFEKKEMKAGDVVSLLSCLDGAISELSEYLLEPSLLVLKPECVMMREMGRQIRFCCYPQNDLRAGENELGEFLIEHVDNEDEEAVRLSYGFFELVSAGNYDLKELLNSSEGAAGSESGIAAENGVLEEYAPEAENVSYYYNNAGEDEEEETFSEGELLRPLLVSGILILLAGAAYIYIFMHPALLSAVGIKQEDYILAGAILTAILAMVIIISLQLIAQKRRKELEQERNEKEQERTMMIPEDKGELIEHSLESVPADSGEETTILSPGTGIAEEGSYLMGYVGDRALRIDLNKSPFRIGKARGFCDGVIDAPGISRIHTVFEESVSGWYVSDENSTNGTRVNGNLLKTGEQHAVFPGDRIGFGEHEFVFVSCLPS